jgi:hypothetical protein
MYDFTALASFGGLIGLAIFGHFADILLIMSSALPHC